MIKNNNRDGRRWKRVFRGVKSPEDALTVMQAQYLVDALQLQVGIYHAQAKRLEKEMPDANGNLPDYQAKHRQLTQLFNSLKFVIANRYFSEVSASELPDGELCVSLESALERIEADAGNVDVVLNLVESAAMQWSRAQPRYSSGLNRIHASIKKINAYHANWLCNRSCGDLENRTMPPAPATPQLSQA